MDEVLSNYGDECLAPEQRHTGEALNISSAVPSLGRRRRSVPSDRCSVELAASAADDRSGESYLQA